MNERSNLGRFIRECRVSLGYTSRKIEEITQSRQGLAKISHSNLIAIEKGKHIPTYDKIVTLSEVFSVPTYLFEDQLKLDMAGPQAIPEGTTYESAEALGKEYLAMGDLEQALECFTQSYLLAEQAEIPPPEKNKKVIDARINVANCERRLGLSRVARDELEQIFTLPDIDEVTECKVSWLLSTVYRQLRNFRIAERHVGHAMDIVSRLDDPDLAAKICNSAATIAADRGQNDRAEMLFRQALSLFKKLGNEVEVGRIQRNLGSYYTVKGDYIEAIRLLEAGIEIARKHNNWQSLSSGLCSLAAAHYHLKKYATARKHGKEAREIAQEWGYQDCMFVSLYYLWLVARTENQAKLAGLYFDRLKLLVKKIDFDLPEITQFREYVDGDKEKK